MTLASGRQILVCEETDGGMGHSIHGLYTVDFTNPKFAWASVVLMADSYEDAMLGGVQKQLIARVVLEESGPGQVTVRVFARHGRIALRDEDDGKPLPAPKVSSYQVDFRLAGAQFRVTAETARAGAIFHVR